MKVSRRAQELRAAGREIIDMSAGEPDFPSPAVAVEEARQALADGFTRYTAASGIPDLRRAVAEQYHQRHGSPWQMEHTLITVGAKAALFELIMALVDEGSEVVLHTPAWVSFEEQIRFAGGRVIKVPTVAAEQFAIRAEPLLAAVTKATSAVLINSPTNPTGGLVAALDLRRIVEHCAARGVAVICDETYERFIYGDVEHASVAAIASEFPDTVFLVSSFSKTYAMTGWRIGYVLGPEPWIRKLGALQSHVTSNPTSFAMRGALAALAGAEDDVRRMVAAFARRREFLAERLAALPGVSCAPPTGAFYAFPHVAGCYREGCRGSIALAEYLLDTAGVAVVPGVAFGDDDYLRLSFACSWESLETGLERMAQALAKL